MSFIAGLHADDVGIYHKFAKFFCCTRARALTRGTGVKVSGELKMHRMRDFPRGLG